MEMEILDIEGHKGSNVEDRWIVSEVVGKDN